MCVGVCVQVCVPVGVYKCVDTCGGQRSISGADPQMLPIFYALWLQGLTALELTNKSLLDGQ